MDGMILLLMLAIPLGAAIAWFGYSRRVRKSKFQTVVGLLLIPPGAFLATVLALMAIDSSSRDDAPSSVSPVSMSVVQAPASTEPPVARPAWDRATAKRHGAEALALIETTSKDLQVAIETRDNAGFVRYVTRPLFERAGVWNAQGYPMEFGVCKSALIEAHSYAMTMYQEYLSGRPTDGVRNRKNREWAAKHLKEYRVQCRDAVQHG